MKHMNTKNREEQIIPLELIPEETIQAIDDAMEKLDAIMIRARIQASAWANYMDNVEEPIEEHLDRNGDH